MVAGLQKDLQGLEPIPGWALHLQKDRRDLCSSVLEEGK